MFFSCKICFFIFFFTISDFIHEYSEITRQQKKQVSFLYFFNSSLPLPATLKAQLLRHQADRLQQRYLLCVNIVTGSEPAMHGFQLQVANYKATRPSVIQVSNEMQSLIQNHVTHLRWSYFVKIVNDFQLHLRCTSGFRICTRYTGLEIYITSSF